MTETDEKGIAGSHGVLMAWLRHEVNEGSVSFAKCLVLLAVKIPTEMPSVTFTKTPSRHEPHEVTSCLCL